MSATAIIRAKLAAYAALVTKVPTSRIMVGDLPQGTLMPAISVMQISAVPRLTVEMATAGRMHTSRVQVTLMVADIEDASDTKKGYTGLGTIMPLILAACPQTRGTVAGFHVDSILPDVEGPDLPMGDPAMITRSRDFIVRWTEA